MSKYTSEGLPIVSKATVETLGQEANLKEFNFEELSRRILKENPEVWNFIERNTLGFFKGYKGKKISDYGALVSLPVGVYELLKRQAEANKLNKQYGS